MSEWTEWVECPELIYRGEDKVWENSRYQVRVSELETGITHLSIKRLKKEAIHDWRELLRIKNELTHPEREAIEIYPAMWRVVDTSNQYHLWVLPLGLGLNLGFLKAHVEDESPDRFVRGEPRQRPLPNWLPRVNVGDRTPVTRYATGSDGEGGIVLTFPLILTSINEAAALDDLFGQAFHDIMVRIQGDIKVADSGLAGMFFHAHEETWKDLTHDERVEILSDYVDQELRVK